MNVATDAVVVTVGCIAIILGFTWLWKMKAMVSHQKEAIGQAPDSAAAAP